eukprot:TRINITY_DN11659_c0_g1_i1.p1 TRINITY_DN11659_c0_g1~~TRINITY_DN11659_c0_g1_i1.p1  ORF type:complete len:368 (+),score=38.70 TRINITY_DN11659_c0_g1_i1:101-1204(+)
MDEVGVLAQTMISSLRRAGTLSGDDRIEAARALLEYVTTPIADSPNLRHFEYLATYFAQNPSIAELFWDAAAPMVGNAHLPPLFAAVCFRWLCEHGSASHAMRINIFLEGIVSLFAHDAENLALRFQHIYTYLRDTVLLGIGGAITALSLAHLMSLTSIIARYMPHYEFHPLDAPPAATSGAQLSALVSRIAGQLETRAGLASTAATMATAVSPTRVRFVSDLFYQETVAQLGLIRTAPVLITYVYFSSMLGVLPASARNALRLEGQLYCLSTPGGPHYPNRAVRIAARLALDVLRPRGKFARWVVRSIFRCLRPIHAFTSIAHATIAHAAAVARPVVWVVSAVTGCCRRTARLHGAKPSGTDAHLS